MLALTRVTRVTCPQITINNQRLGERVEANIVISVTTRHYVTLCHTHHCVGATSKMNGEVTPRPHTPPDIAPLPLHARTSETYQWFTLVKLIIKCNL